MVGQPARTMIDPCASGRVGQSVSPECKAIEMRRPHYSIGVGKKTSVRCTRWRMFVYRTKPRYRSSSIVRHSNLRWRQRARTPKPAYAICTFPRIPGHSRLRSDGAHHSAVRTEHIHTQTHHGPKTPYVDADMANVLIRWRIKHVTSTVRCHHYK